MRSSLCFLLIICSDVVFSQTTRTATLLQHRAYLIDVISETMQEVEEYHWSNLRIPDFSADVNYEYFGHVIVGRVSFTRGYVVSIQRLDLLESSVQQVWNWNFINRFGTVDLRSQLRMHDVKLGFDVLATVNGTDHRYTSTFTYPLINFDFSIFKDMRTDDVTVSVTGVRPVPSGSTVLIPEDEYSNVLGVAFQPNETIPGILSWAELFQPRALNVVLNKVPYPEACYNC